MSSNGSTYIYFANYLLASKFNTDITFLLLSVLISLTLILTIFIYYPTLFPFVKRNSNSIRELGGPSILNAWMFFTRRFDFVWNNFKKAGEGDEPFKFKVLQHSVFAVRGETARKDFFDSKDLDFTEGYKVLLGAAPVIKNSADFELDEADRLGFKKALAVVLARNRIAELLPTLLEDIERGIGAWGKEGKIYPFKGFYDVVFQLVVRITCCSSLALDVDALGRVQKRYLDIEHGATPTAVLLPWFPSLAKRQKERSIKELCAILSGYIDERKAAEVPTNDAIDALLGYGLEKPHITALIINFILAGSMNAGSTTSWAMVFLCFSPEWKAKVKAEIDALVLKHADKSSGEPLHKCLSSIPLTAWEGELPFLDAVIRETIRHSVNFTALRRNIASDFVVHGTQISKGDFLAYSAFDVHMNPEIYSDPERFDPGRFLPDREEDKKGIYSFLGWGAGRHPCVGAKIAKVKIKLTIALFFVGYEFDIIDELGKFPESIPKPNYNDIHTVKPLGPRCNIRFRRVRE